MTQLTVYGRADCIQCKQVCKQFDAHGVEYEYVDIDRDARGREAVEQSGIQALPGVFEDGVPLFGGFRPDKIKELIDRAK